MENEINKIEEDIAKELSEDKLRAEADDMKGELDETDEAEVKADLGNE